MRIFPTRVSRLIEVAEITETLQHSRSTRATLRAPLLGPVRMAGLGMLGAYSYGMHALTFGFKRAHFASLNLIRSFTLPEGLTPARFDLLYQLHITRYRRPFQWSLAQRLGVTRATICKMIRALRELGIVELSEDRNNGHMRRIALTRSGRKCFARALKSIRRGKVAAAIRSVWRHARLSRAEVRRIVDKTVWGVRRYCWGLQDYTELYRY